MLERPVALALFLFVYDSQFTSVGVCSSNVGQKCTKLHREKACQIVVVNLKCFQVKQVPKFGRHRSTKKVSVPIELFQLSK